MGLCVEVDHDLVVFSVVPWVDVHHLLGNLLAKDCCQNHSAHDQVVDGGCLSGSCHRHCRCVVVDHVAAVVVAFWDFQVRCYEWVSLVKKWKQILVVVFQKDVFLKVMFFPHKKHHHSTCFHHVYSALLVLACVGSGAPSASLHFWTTSVLSSRNQLQLLFLEQKI